MPIFCGERIASVSAAKAKTTEDSKKNKTAVDEASLAGADMSLEDEKIDASLSTDDLLEGVRGRLKAAEDAEVNLPKVTTRSSKVRRRSADTSVTMLTGDPVRMYAKEDRQSAVADRCRRNRPRHEDRGWRRCDGGARKGGKRKASSSSVVSVGGLTRVEQRRHRCEAAARRGQTCVSRRVQ